MNFREWFKTKSTQEKMMLLCIILLLIMIATRWGVISRLAGDSFKRRFVPPTEQADSTSSPRPDSTATTRSASTTIARPDSTAVTRPDSVR